MTSNSKLKLSVIIPIKNGAGTLQACLKSIFKSFENPLEVIIVNDHSTDETLKIASQFPVKLLHLTDKAGSGEARNLGSKHAKGQILLHTDADVELLDNSLKKILDYLEKNPQISAVFGSYASDCPYDNFFSQYKNLHHHFVHQHSNSDAFTFWTGFGAVRKEVFDELKGFRTNSFIRHINDIDFGYRARKRGHQIRLVPDIQVIHHKKYGFWSLVKSDLFERAIPWTRTIWDNKTFKNDLNTRINHSLSICFVFISLFFLLTGMDPAIKIAGLAASLGFVGFLNFNWVRFCWKNRGILFAIRALVMEWIYFFISGLGFGIGTLQHFLYQLRRLLPFVILP